MYRVLNVNEHIPGAQIRLLAGDKSLWTETVDLTPDDRRGPTRMPAKAWTAQR